MMPLFVRKLIGPRLRNIFFIITNIFAAIVCWYLLLAAFTFVQGEAEAQTILLLNLPTWYFVVIIPIGYGIIAFRFVVSVIQTAVEMAQGNWAIKEHV